jgi:hypothetical protein
MGVAGRPDYAGQLLADCLLEPAVSVTGYVFYARQAPLGELRKDFQVSSVSLSAV